MIENANKVKCPYCVDGQIEVLLNYAEFHFHADEPIIEYEACEECGGTGEMPISEESEEDGE